MPEFKPFKGIRPSKDFAEVFVTKSVDSYSKEELEKVLESNPDSFLQIIKPTWEDELPQDERHQKVRANFIDFVNSEHSEKDRPSYYVYQLTQPEKNPVRALIGLINMNDYADGNIKKHEETLTKRVELFADYLKDVHFHAEPVLLTYPHTQRVDLLMELEMKPLPLISITDEEGNLHELWQVRDRLNMRQIKASIEKYDAFYIADGHHRLASSYEYTKYMDEQTDDSFDSFTHEYALAMLISDKELIINDFNRLVKDLNGMSESEFLEKLGEVFEIMERGDQLFFPSKKHHLGMYLNGEFYSMYFKKAELKEKGLAELDTYLFEELVLKPILNIQNSRDDDRVEFIRGSGDREGIEELQKAVDSGKYKAGFYFYPVSAIDLEKIADLGLKMPPKSTYILPKPLSGLTIFRLKK